MIPLTVKQLQVLAGEEATRMAAIDGVSTALVVLISKDITGADKANYSIGVKGPLTLGEVMLYTVMGLGKVSENAVGASESPPQDQH